MITTKIDTSTPLFLEDVMRGLSAKNKSLPSKYFYDERGDELFVEIMHMPEYYLSRAELDIFQNRANDLIKSLGVNPKTTFELIELGAGDGSKTKELLRELLDQNYDFVYRPIDISGHVLDVLQQNLELEIPACEIEPLTGDYFHILGQLKNKNTPKIILFLGSNLGNMTDNEAKKFIAQLAKTMNAGDKLILGLDLIKSSEIVSPAYNDQQGITARFNMNLLARMNRELKADFDLNSFKHAPDYDENTGIATSGLMSLKDQIVHLGKDRVPISFKKGEIIHTEISRKYNRQILEEILAESGLKINSELRDKNNYFSDFIIEKLAF